jgi:SepF-like predicted cell division protein (DUF552 family)
VGLLHDILGKVRSEEETVELPEEQEETRQVTIRIETLKDFVDIDRISRLLKEGNIVFIKGRDLQRNDLGEFQNCVQKLKRVCGQYGWDIVGTEEGYLIVTPQFAKIER